MALRRRKTEQQDAFGIAAGGLPRPHGYIFYRKPNGPLRETGFDQFAETLCQAKYHVTQGRSGIPPGVYGRLHFEEIGQPGFARLCGDSLSPQRVGNPPGQPLQTRIDRIATTAYIRQPN